MKVKLGRLIVITGFFLIVFGLSLIDKIAWAADPAMISPKTGTILSSSTVTFKWSEGNGVVEYWLGVGTSQAKIDSSESHGDIYNLSTGTKTSATVTGININGNKLYVRLHWRLKDSPPEKPWTDTDYIYQTKTPIVGGAGCSDSWSKVIPDANERFELVMPTAANPGGEAVLDKETCLVWELSPGDTDGDMDVDGDDWIDWNSAIMHCYMKTVGGRKGWRSPTIEELATLAEPNAGGALPAGHPFQNVQSSLYWSSTTFANNTSKAWFIEFGIGSIGQVFFNTKSIDSFVWCVRGGQGHDAY